MSDYSKLEKCLDYQFKNKNLIIEALTHKSFKKPYNNERLEFLGDAVLNLIVGEYLYTKFPKSNEGELSKIRASLVNETGFTKLANEIKLGDYIFISNAEERNKGRTKSSILSDAFEAIMGAIYLESGLETLKPIILKLLEESYDKINLDVLFSDYKTALQEITQARFASIPEYIIEGSYGPDHKKEFEVSIKIDEEFIQSEMNRRKPGQNEFATKRNEGDVVEILSGVFEGYSTGTSISMIIFNENQKSSDYSNIKDLFRPGHADFTYFNKYGIRDYRGGGRSSARETATRVAAGAIAKLLLKELNIDVKSGICEINGIKAETYDFANVSKSEIFALDPNVEEDQKNAILDAKNSHNSVGGVALVNVKNCPVGLGEPIYHKLDAQIANAMMSINAVKAVEIGDGILASKVLGYDNNDQIRNTGFKTNHSGGMLGGISNGDDINVKVYFKATPSIFIEQDTIDVYGNEVVCKLKGRHDPCVAVRGSVVAESMMALVIADMLLLNLSSKIDNIKKVYEK